MILPLVGLFIAIVVMAVALASWWASSLDQQGMKCNLCKWEGRRLDLRWHHAGFKVGWPVCPSCGNRRVERRYGA